MGVPVTPVIELVGPAGVGKTAVLRAIAVCDASLRAGIRIGRLRLIPTVLWGALALTPAAAEMLFTDPRWLWSGLRHLGRLRAFPSELERERRLAPRAILLDEGPVFSLGRLRVFHHAGEGSGWLAQKWQAELDRWAEGLDGVILLDAPNPVLRERIRKRVKEHPVKTGSDQEIEEFLERYRAAYRHIVTRLRAAGHVRILELDTAVTPVDRLATDVLAALGSWSGGATPVARSGGA